MERTEPGGVFTAHQIWSMEQKGCRRPISAIEAAAMVKNNHTMMSQCEESKERNGFAVFRLDASKMWLIRLFVDPAHRRKGVASHMLRKLTDHLDKRVPKLQTIVSEYDTDLQLVLKSVGFRALDIFRRGENVYWPGLPLAPDEDHYFFRIDFRTVKRMKNK